MRRFLTLALPFLIVALGLSFPRVPISGPIYSITEFGAVGDGTLASAAANTTAINAAWAAAANSATPGLVEVPPSAKGYVVNNGQINVTASNVSIRGDANMGSNLSNGPTSTIIGHGVGDTLTISGAGGSLKGIEFRPFAAGEQKGADSFLKITGNAVSVSDLHIWSPNTGISLQLPTAAEGEFWLKDILVEGQIGISGITANCGNAAVSIQHVIMFSQDPQPPYGVVVTSCGELVMNSGCDIISCGTCLALVPGLGGVKGQHVNAVFVSDCLFDSPNGTGGVYICPFADANVSLVKFVNCWASTANNNQGKWNTNGFTLDGSQANPAPPLKAIMDVTFTGCNSRSFVNHCGWFAKAVYGVTWNGCTASGNFVGIQTANCVGIVSLNKLGDYSPGPVGYPAGNAAYGAQFDKSQMVFNPGDNLLGGNGVAPFKINP